MWSIGRNALPGGNGTVSGVGVCSSSPCAGDALFEAAEATHAGDAERLQPRARRVGPSAEFAALARRITGDSMRN